MSDDVSVSGDWSTRGVSDSRSSSTSKRRWLRSRGGNARGFNRGRSGVSLDDVQVGSATTTTATTTATTAVVAANVAAAKAAAAARENRLARLAKGKKKLLSALSDFGDGLLEQTEKGERISEKNAKNRRMPFSIDLLDNLVESNVEEDFDCAQEIDEQLFRLWQREPDCIIHGMLQGWAYKDVDIVRWFEYRLEMDATASGSMTRSLPSSKRQEGTSRNSFSLAMGSKVWEPDQQQWLGDLDLECLFDIVLSPKVVKDSASRKMLEESVLIPASLQQLPIRAAFPACHQLQTNFKLLGKHEVELFGVSTRSFR